VAEEAQHDVVAAREREATTSRASKQFFHGLKLLQSANSGSALLQRRRFEQAAAEFAAAEEGFSQYLTHYESAGIARVRRAVALGSLQRYDEALEILDALIASPISFPDFPDELPSIYWSRAVYLQQLGRVDEADGAAEELLAKAGSGATPKQRGFVAQAFLLQAQSAEATGRLDDALAAAEAAIAQCSIVENPSRRSEVLGAAEPLRASLLERVKRAGPRH
jgi:tetratricopeptide (TPR) repeat protein